MEPKKPALRKRVGKSRQLLTVRSALIFLLAALTALGGAGLLLAAHRTAVLATFSGFGIFGLAVPFWNEVIELSLLISPLVHRVRLPRRAQTQPCPSGVPPAVPCCAATTTCRSVAARPPRRSPVLPGPIGVRACVR